jgi:hypothetical protein
MCELDEVFGIKISTSTCPVRMVSFGKQAHSISFNLLNVNEGVTDPADIQSWYFAQYQGFLGSRTASCATAPLHGLHQTHCKTLPRRTGHYRHMPAGTG